MPTIQPPNVKPPKRQAGVRFVLVTVFLDILGIGIIIPVLPGLVAELTRGSVTSQPIEFGLLLAAYALMQFIFSPILGALSDRIGRRPVLLASTGGLAADFLLSYFASNMSWLFVARILSGITSANISTANAYIADVTTPEERVKQFGLVGAVIGIGFITGPALGGLLGIFSPRLPFLVAAVLCSLNFLYGWFVLPESRTEAKRAKHLALDINPLKTISSLRRFPIVRGLVTSILCASLAQQALQSIWILYTTYRYSWNPLENGLSLMFVGILTAIVQGGLVARIARWLGEPRTLVLGLALAMLSQLFYGLSSQGWMLYAVMLAGALGGVAGPVAQAMISRTVPSTELGAVQGALSSLTSLTAVVAPPMATALFSAFTSRSAPMKVPGISFFTGALILAIGLVVAYRFLSRYQIEKIAEDMSEEKQSL